MKEINVGDQVVVWDVSKVYPNYDTWRGWKDTPIDCVARYQYARDVNIDYHIGKVIHIAPHNDSNEILAAIEMRDTGHCYLFNIKGLKPYE